MDFDGLEEALIRCSQSLQSVGSWFNTITDPDELLVLQVRLATIALLAQGFEDECLRARMAAA